MVPPLSPPSLILFGTTACTCSHQGSNLMMQAKQKGAEWLANAVLHGVMAAVALPYTAWSAIGLLSSQWGLVLNRAARAGELLAHVLMSGAHGGRPVTLIGYSMGARLIYHCLLELARCRWASSLCVCPLLDVPSWLGDNGLTSRSTSLILSLPFG